MIVVFKEIDEVPVNIATFGDIIHRKVF